MLADVVARLRVPGSDLTRVEAKSAAGGMPESINATLSAFANTPGGGLVLLGLDEASGFRPVGLADPAGLAAGLAARARNFHPPVRFEELGPVPFEGAEVVVARVAECPVSAKPCRAPDGRAYLRAFDGDYPLSVVEEQGFLASRGTPTFDRQPVAGATTEDLDGASLAVWSARIATSGSSLARFTGDELARRAGIIEGSGTPTVAGLLAFGKYPQQWFPRFIINAGVASPAADDGLVRLADHEVIDGPIPVMLDRAMAWAERTFTRALYQDKSTGMVADRRQFPMIAFREIMSNALVHRDLADWSTGQAIEVRITARGALVVTNPGGLYGITADRLGAEHVTSARNPVLVRLVRGPVDPSPPSNSGEATPGYRG